MRLLPLVSLYQTLERSLKSQISVAKEPYKTRAFVHKRPSNSGSLLDFATSWEHVYAVAAISWLAQIYMGWLPVRVSRKSGLILHILQNVTTPSMAWLHFV